MNWQHGGEHRNLRSSTIDAVREDLTLFVALHPFYLCFQALFPIPFWIIEFKNNNAITKRTTHLLRIQRRPESGCLISWLCILDRSCWRQYRPSTNHIANFRTRQHFRRPGALAACYVAGLCSCRSETSSTLRIRTVTVWACHKRAA